MDLSLRTPARRIGELITTAVFLVGIALPVGGRFLDEGADTSTLPERRAPAPPPTLDRGLLRIPREFDAWLNDSFGFRRYLIRWHNIVKLFGFQVEPTDRLLLGRDRWLFTTGNVVLDAYRGAFQLTEHELELWRRMLEDRHDWLAKRGIEYVFLVAPDKPDVYPEQLPRAYVRGATTPLDQLLAHMEARSEVRVLDVREPLRAAKADDRADDYLYYPHGTHWSERGALVGYREILATIAPGMQRWSEALVPWSDDDFERVVAPNVGDDWDERLHIPDLLPERNVRMLPRRERRAEKRAGAVEDGEVFEVADAELPRAMLIHDSFGLLLQQPLAEHFSYLRTVNDLDLPTELILDTRPDVVIHVMAERRLSAYRPLGTSLEEGEASRERFEGAEDVLLRLDEPHELRAIESWRKAKLTPARGPEDPPLAVRTLGGGQGFLVPEVELPDERVPVLMIDLQSKRATTLSVVFQTEARRDYVPARTLQTDLVEGRNVVYVEIPAPDLVAPLLILPGRERGRFEINAVEVRAATFD
jgi:hypothetical protein